MKTFNLTVDLKKLSKYFPEISAEKGNNHYHFSIPENKLEEAFQYMELEKEWFNPENRSEILHLVSYLPFIYLSKQGKYVQKKQVPHYFDIPAGYRYFNEKDICKIAAKSITKIRNKKAEKGIILTKDDIEEIEFFIDYRYRYTDCDEDIQMFQKLKTSIKNKNENADLIIDDFKEKREYEYLKAKFELWKILAESDFIFKIGVNGVKKSATKITAIKNADLIHEIRDFLLQGLKPDENQKKKFEDLKKFRTNNLRVKSRFLRQIIVQLKVYLEAETNIPLNIKDKKNLSKEQAVFIGYFLSFCGFLPTKIEIIQSEMQEDRLILIEKEIENFVSFYLYPDRQAKRPSIEKFVPSEEEELKIKDRLHKRINSLYIRR